MAAETPPGAKPTANPKPVDTRYVVTISPDFLSAALTVQPPENGGLAPDGAAARKALDQAGVVFGIDPARIEEALGDSLGRAVEVARGTPTQPGIDARLEPLLPTNEHRHPKVDAQGHVDFRERGAIPAVNPGDALMRRHPPIPGSAGRGVHGRELPLAAPKNLGFAVRLEGAAPDPHDPDLLRATVAGQPILLRDGVNVEPILRLETVDISSGNIDFIGSVEVKGDVRSGMKIKAGGDISVGGVIESAELQAGGEVVARAGIIGHAPQDAKEGQAQETARINAKGCIHARFVENGTLMSEQSVIIEEAAIQCDIVAIDQVIVGGKGDDLGKTGGKTSGKGRIVGGFVRATTGIRTDVLGGPGSGKTRIFCGVNPLLQRALDEHKQRLEAKLKENGELTKVLKLLKGRLDKQALFDKARLTLKKVNEEIAEIMDEQRGLESQLRVADDAHIVVAGRVHAGVMVAIGKKSKFVGEDAGPGVFLMANGELVYGDLAAHGG